jgi:hypothetical protein
VRNVYGCEPPFLRGNDGVKSGYVVKGGTVRRYWSTREADSGTKLGQKRYKTGTEVGHLRGGNKSLGGQLRLMCYRPLKRAETIPRRIRP